MGGARRISRLRPSNFGTPEEEPRFGWPLFDDRSPPAATPTPTLPLTTNTPPPWQGGGREGGDRGLATPLPTVCAASRMS